MFVRDFAVNVAVGAILLLSLSRLIGRVQFSASNAGWCSFIGHVLLSIISFVAGFFFSRQMDDGSTNINGIATITALAVGCFLQAVLFQVFARTQNDTLARWRAVVLSLVVIMGDIFVASPLIELWEHLRK